MSHPGLPPTHFLSQARHTRALGPRPGDTYDVSTVAAADYDIDVRSGFMPPAEPVARLADEFALWEEVLDAAFGHIKLASDLVDAAEDEKRYVDSWRERVGQMTPISADSLFQDERSLRRAHLVLTYIMHFYVHSAKHDISMPITIPESIAVPLVAVSRELGLPPILTYADTVLWNWKLNNPLTPQSPNGRSRGDGMLAPFAPPSTDISTRTSFTDSPDENHFYMTSALIELRGVEALGLMRRTLDETFLSDALAARRVANYLSRLAHVIDEITQLILDVRKKCDPEVFYYKIRPWFHGASAHTGMGWMFEGVEFSDREKEAWGMLGGPSAGQSSLVHALDVFLGVNHSHQGPPRPNTSSSSSPVPLSHAISTSASTPPLTPSLTSSSASSSTNAHAQRTSPDATFLQRMQQYMPRHHRAFLQYLGTVEKPVRTFVAKNKHSTRKVSPPARTFRSFSSAVDTPSEKQVEVEVEAIPAEPPLTRAYNEAVDALTRFRDAHIRITTLFIVNQAHKARSGPANGAPRTNGSESDNKSPSAVNSEFTAAVGTGGTQLVPFLKSARQNTIHAALR